MNEMGLRKYLELSEMKHVYCVSTGLVLVKRSEPKRSC